MAELRGVGWGFTASDMVIFNALTSEGGTTRTVCYKRLCEETGLLDRTLRNRLKVLEETGWLRIRHSRPGGRWRTNTYQVILPAARNAAGRELLLPSAR